MAIIIPLDFGVGGKGLKGGRLGLDARNPNIRDVFNEVVLDIAKVKVATITSPDATDEASAVTLVNEIKTKLNTIAATTPGLSLAT